MPGEQRKPERMINRSYAQRLLRMRENMLPGHRADIRDVVAIVRSRRRSVRQCADPARSTDVSRLDLAERVKRCRESGLADLNPRLSSIFRRGNDLHVITVHDLDGWVLCRYGSNQAQEIADVLGLVEGACWAETAVGTNAAGTALIEDRGLFCLAHEHHADSHHPYFCAATPLHDPWNRRQLGVLNVTTLVESATPDTLLLVELAARYAEQEAAKTYAHQLMLLREAAASTLSTLGTPAVITDRRGRVAAAPLITRRPRELPFPTGLDQPFECSQLGGWWVVEPFRSGWLWKRVDADHTSMTRVELDVRQPTRWSLTVHGGGTSTPYDLSKKCAEILFLLARTSVGRTAAELAQDLYGDSAKKETVRVLIRRVRKLCGGLLDSEPYRFKDHLEVTVKKPDDLADLLPSSAAPTICRIRAGTSI